MKDTENCQYLNDTGWRLGSVKPDRLKKNIKHHTVSKL